MKAIITVYKDGSQHINLWVEDDFDTEQWVKERAGNLLFLGVTRIEEQYFSESPDSPSEHGERQ